MRISVFTPTHNPRFLDLCYESLCRQTYTDWEWIVLLNGRSAGVASGEAGRAHHRVARRGRSWCGRRQARRMQRATGDMLVELDHDDELASDMP